MKFGLLGRKLGHSYSPKIHKMLHGVPYALYEAEPEAVEEFLKTTDLDGINVTIPYKETVLKHCVWLSETARKIGCVNTLLKKEDGWHGYNTDYYGFCRMLLEAGIDPAGKKCMILGNGGASLTARTALQDLGASGIVIMSRKPGTGRRGPGTGKESSSPVSFDTYDHLGAYKDTEVIVNTTPVGMYPENGAALLDPADFPLLKGTADVIYNPARTKFLLLSERAGIPYAGGLAMLVAQAKKSAEIWLSEEIDDSRIRKIRDQLSREMQNIILIGMPGSGKSSVGKALSGMTGRRFADADEEIIETAGKSIPEIFREEGEEGFRRRETEALKKLGKESGLIIATGGGCVTRPENYPLIHQNGSIVWIRRNLSLLPSDGRPLSQANPPEKLWNERKESYAAFADFTADNDGTVEETAEKILKLTAEG